MPNRPLTSSVSVPQVTFDPGSALSQIAQIQTSQNTIEAARRKSMARLRMQQLSQEHLDDPEAFIQAVTREFPAEGFELKEAYEKGQKEQYQAYDAKTKAETNLYENATRMLQATNGDPTAYGFLRDGFIKRDPRLEAVLPPPDQLTPEKFQQILALGQSTTDYLKAKGDGIKLFGEGKYQEGLGAALAAAPNPETARATLKEAAQDPRAKMAVVLFTSILDATPDFNEAKKAFAQAAISPTDQARLSKESTAQGSDFAKYLETFAREKGVSVDQLTSADVLKARKDFGRADDRPININTGGQRPMTQTAEAGLITKLSGQWSTATKSQKEINRQVTIMDQGLAAGRKGNLPQANEAVLQTFLKILDPESVVREGEFQRLREGASLTTRAQAAIQRLSQGGFLPMSELEKYAQLAKEVQAATKGVIDPVRERIGKTADRYKIPRELVLDESVDVGAAPSTKKPAYRFNPKTNQLEKVAP